MAAREGSAGDEEDGGQDSKKDPRRDCLTVPKHHRGSNDDRNGNMHQFERSSSNPEKIKGIPLIVLQSYGMVVFQKAEYLPPCSIGELKNEGFCHLAVMTTRGMKGSMGQQNSW